MATITSYIGARFVGSILVKFPEIRLEDTKVCVHLFLIKRPNKQGAGDPKGKQIFHSSNFAIAQKL